MSTPTASIMQYTEDQWPEIDRFWMQILGRDWNDDARARWRWLNQRRTHFLSVQNGRILGNATLLRQPFVTADGAPLDTGWITDLYVSPELKGQGIGKSLTRRLKEEVDVLITFGQSEAARHCLRSLGWEGPEWIALIGLTLPGLRRRPSTAADFSQTPHGSDLFDSIWMHRGERAACLGIRNSESMAQRFQGRPDAEYESWVLNRGHSPLGWIVLRTIQGRPNRRFGRVPTGLIVDLLAVDDDPTTLAELAAFGVWRLGRRGAWIALAVNTPGRTGQALVKSGFRPGFGFGPLQLRGLPQKGFMQSRMTSPFHLTFFDCDAELTF